MRKLVSLQMLQDIQPIEGADRILQARVNGWDLVVLKEHFWADSWCFFFEIDSIIPPYDTLGFIPKASSKHNYYHIKTRKFKGVVSQGLAIPLYLLQPLLEERVAKGEITQEQSDEWLKSLAGMKLDDEVTDFFGVYKYEPPVKGEPGEPKGDFPLFYVNKTDETRLQSAPRLFEKLQGEPVISTLKYDGTSFTGIFDSLKEDDKLIVASRNNIRSADESEGNYYAMVSNRYGLRNILEGVLRYIKSEYFMAFDPTYVALQAELCGPSIQENKLKLHALKLFAFNLIVGSDKGRLYFYYNDMKRILEEASNIAVVEKVSEYPRFFEGMDYKMALSYLQLHSQGKYPNTDQEREGLVFRVQPENYAYTRLPILSAKMINNNFLLKASKKLDKQRKKEEKA